MSISTYVPAILIIVTVLGLYNMDHLLYLVGESMEVLAGPLCSQDMARLDGMLVVVMVDMLMRVKMLVLVLVGLELMLSKTMVMLLVLVGKVKKVIVILGVSRLRIKFAVGEVFEAVWQDEANGRRGCAKRNERDSQSHGQDCPRERERKKEDVHFRIRCNEPSGILKSETYSNNGQKSILNRQIASRHLLIIGSKSKASMIPSRET
jgi:hypothetical protein